MFTNVIQGVVLVALLTVGEASIGPPHPDESIDGLAASPVGASLPNLVEYDPRVLVGGVPGGEAAFQRLARAGVKTIVSVDGAIPDVEAARRHGIRYVHLPIGYRGIEPERRLEIARAVQDGRARGEVYVHCHHGKHRCAAAAATALVSLGILEPPEGISLMRRSGTSSHYPGLFRVVRDAVPIDPISLQSVRTPQAEIERPDGVVESMLVAAEALERLSHVAEAGWTVPAQHPDLQPVTEAAAVTEAMRLMLEVESSSPHGDPDLVDRARRSAVLAGKLERLLDASRTDSDSLHATFKALSATCVECHRAHRGRYRMDGGAKDVTSAATQEP